MDSQWNDFLNDIHQIACLAPFFQNHPTGGSLIKIIESVIFKKSAKAT
jgi:hypothetical protein